MKKPYCRVRVEWLVRDDYNNTSTLSTVTLSFGDSTEFEPLATRVIKSAVINEENKAEALNRLPEILQRGDQKLSRLKGMECVKKERLRDAQEKEEKDAAYLRGIGGKLDGKAEEGR